MRILCPGCQRSLAVTENTHVLSCPACAFETPLSQLGTAPGLASIPAVRDYTGERVGPYQVHELVGQGGMGVVYRARRADAGDDEPDRDVALKILHPDARFRRDEFVARFEREARALDALEHPCIVRLLDHGQADGVHYLVTEFIEGHDLAELMKRERLSLERAIEIFVAVCAGMAYAHQRDIVHRDLKPANILVASEGQVKVLDFGLAQMTGADMQVTSLTRTDLAMGTFNYLAPEQRLNAKAVDRRADVYSLGVILYEMLTGTLPLGRFAMPSELDPRLGRDVDRVLDRALSASPDDRYQDVTEFMVAVDTLRPRQRNGGRRALVALALASVLGLTGLVTASATGLFASSEPVAGDAGAVTLERSSGVADAGAVTATTTTAAATSRDSAASERDAGPGPLVGARDGRADAGVAADPSRDEFEVMLGSATDGRSTAAGAKGMTTSKRRPPTGEKRVPRGKKRPGKRTLSKSERARLGGKRPDPVEIAP